MESFFSPVDEQTQKRERAKARELRASGWWKNQVGRGVCYYCGEKVHPSLLSMDHKTPVVRGGKSTKNNLVPCCKDCNTEKKYMLLSEWIAKRAEEGRPLHCARNELY